MCRNISKKKWLEQIQQISQKYIPTLYTLKLPVKLWPGFKWWEIKECFKGMLSTHTFQRMRLMMPNKSIPATAATMKIQRGTSYGVSSPNTGSMFTENYTHRRCSQLLSFVSIDPGFSKSGLWSRSYSYFKNSNCV